MNAKQYVAIASAAVALSLSGAAWSQSTFQEDFTGATTSNNWYFFNGACLTAGSTSSATSPGQPPSCISIASSYYAQANDKDPALVGGYAGVSGNSQTLPDSVGHGALRFTNGYPYGHDENGAIVSAATFNAGQGIQITFKTVTYRGDSGGAGKDGADGMSFYLMDGSVSPSSTLWNGIGSWGGSLGYTCSNSNPPYDGLIGAYLGLGIDEYGNFLNGANLASGYTGSNTATGDNSASGYGYKPNRIGLRGTGNISWAYLNANYATYYPSSLTTAQRQSAVQATCKSGLIQNASSGSPVATATSISDYAPIVNAYSELPSTSVLANESANARPDGTAVQNVFLYNLQITQNGLLSFSYSMNGGTYVPVITSQSITASNGALPATLRFGFAGSTGGDTNIHEILCFKAAPSTVSASSATVNEKQTSQVQTSSQAYFAFYNPNDWTGRVTAFGLVDTNGVVSIQNLANWDSECVLTGVPSGQSCLYTAAAGPTAAEATSGSAGSGRQIMTWSSLNSAASTGAKGIPFTFASLSNGTGTLAEQAAVGGSSSGSTRVDYLRGGRSNEINSAGAGLYRARDGVLADIIDASPTWVGPPSAPYAVTWVDRYDGSADTITETGASYQTFLTTNQSRLNVIYAGANDGFLHGFRTGSEDINGNVSNTSATPNDGAEVIAYMPGEILNTIHSATTSLDYSNPQYSHAFYVDATPGTGDVFYSSAWHTILVGGLGAGGAGIYALDISAPGSFAESSAASTVLGDWSSSTISCVGNTSCGNNLGNTYGTPQIRRFHNGTWGAVFGNGYGSSSGDAGIYVMTISGTSPVTFNFYYLSTGSSGSNGIAYVSPADLDGDHITDYVYAGDLKGNVWRFDLTSTNAASWGVTSQPVFKTPSGQPITTQLVLASAVVSGSLPSVIVSFGTGQRTQFTTTSATSYATNTTQSLYGVWDWNFATWNAKSTAAQYASLTSTQANATAWKITASKPVSQSLLTQQTFTVNTGTTTTITTTNNAITWAACTGAATSTCSGKFGWFANLPQTNGTTSAGATIQEQIVSNPSLFEDGLVVNSTIPANNQPLNCTSPTTDQGVTYVIAIVSGGTFASGGASPGSGTSSFNSAFINYRDTATAGIQTNETGALTVVNTKEGSTYLIGQDIAIPAAGTAPGSAQQIALSDTTVNRLTWIQLR